MMNVIFLCIQILGLDYYQFVFSPAWFLDWYATALYEIELTGDSGVGFYASHSFLFLHHIIVFTSGIDNHTPDNATS